MTGLEALIVIVVLVLLGLVGAFAAVLTWTAIFVLLGLCAGLGIGGVLYPILLKKHMAEAKADARKEYRDHMLDFMALVRLGQESRYPIDGEILPSAEKLPAPLRRVQ